MAMAPKGRRALPPRRSQGRIGFVFLAIFLVLVVAVLGWLVPRLQAIQTTLREVVVTPVPEFVPGATPEPTPVPIREPSNILLMGLDRREGASGALNDVNIVVHVNPGQGFSSMLSIPRDTRVEIPGHGYHKINAAYNLGEEFHRDTGGGPVLVERTVEQFLDMPIHYWAEVNFRGFERIIDMVGGIDVDVPVPLVDNEYPTEDYGYMRIYIPAGLQHMDGRTALQYARSRHADSDIGRNQRQQQVLMALRERVVRLETLFDLDRTRELLDGLGDALRTNMQPDTLWSFLWLAPAIDSDNVASYILDWRVFTEIREPVYYLDPCVPCVREIVQEMQINPTLGRLREEGARVEVRNGTWTCQDCAARTAEYLRQHGLTVGDALQDRYAGSYTRTLILGAEAYPATRDQILALLGLQPDCLRPEPSDSDRAEIVIILGEDYRLPTDE